MSADIETAERIVQQVVVGERLWTDLLPLGMEGGPSEARCQFHSSFPRDTRVSIHELARGFLTFLPDIRKLREWALVMEALPTEFAIENHPAGETVLNALWSASFGDPLSDDQIAVLVELAKEQMSQS
jgi:hypothetical protein